ncbi:hypothetical protein B0H10DRAFT_2447483 [Mycena sp. CBHHK59/15]|nr:hypothetical protein B0H10DRAFT_2447483 [Mycena sp. CBHHK59/15]
MASDVGQSKHISANQELIDSLSGHDLMQFRHYIHSPAYIHAHAEVFLDNVWINISELRDFLLERNTGDFPGSTSLARPLPLLAQVKREITDVRLSASATPLIIKVEPTINSDPIPIRTRILREDNHDILEILSDSEPENGGVDSDEEVSEALIWAASRSSSILPPNISTTIDLCSDDDEPDLEESDTVWQDEGISSHVLIGDYRVTAKVKVGRLEYVSGLPSIYPIHRVPTALIVNLEDPKYNIYDKDGVLHIVDFLIKNKSTGEMPKKTNGKQRAAINREAAKRNEAPVVPRLPVDPSLTVDPTFVDSDPESEAGQPEISFHCELNPIEMVWSQLKRRFRELTDGTAKTLVPESLDLISNDNIRRYFGHCYRYMDAYRVGLNLRQAAYAVKEFKSHRRIPANVHEHVGIVERASRA